MAIELEFPFSEKYKRGYITTAKSGNKLVILYNSGSDKSSVSLARYVLGVKLKRWLTPDEQIEYIDGVDTNFDPDNLRIKVISPEDKKRVTKYITLKCPGCGNTFEKNIDIYRNNERKGKQNFCTYTCWNSTRGKLPKAPKDLSLVAEFNKKVVVPKLIYKTDVRLKPSKRVFATLAQATKAYGAIPKTPKVDYEVKTKWIGAHPFAKQLT